MVERLALLNEQLQAKNIVGELCVVGGSAMVLAFGSRKSTQDIDALMKPTSEIRALVQKNAEEHSFPPNWINDGVKGFLPSKKDMEIKG